MVTGNTNLKRIGMITNRERHSDSFDVVHVKDGNSFATWLSNIFVIGKGNNHEFLFPMAGVSASPLLERETRDWQPSRVVGEVISR